MDDMLAQLGKSLQASPGGSSFSHLSSTRPFNILPSSYSSPSFHKHTATL
jgi:hypothetical protein